MTHLTDKDFTPTGVRIEGAYENDRNADSSELFKAIIREAFGVQDTLIGHHLLYVKVDKQPDPEHPGNTFDIQVVQEIPSADALIFDTDVAQKIWGYKWKNILSILAVTPVSERDKLLGDLYHSRGPVFQSAAEEELAARQAADAPMEAAS